MNPRSVLMTEAEAAKLVCPVLTRLESGQNPVTCIASACMAWREIGCREVATGEILVRGYCAAFGTPPEISSASFSDTMAGAMRQVGLVRDDA